MATWTVSTKEKKSCEEREIWTKDDMTITRITGFRWGTFSVETTDDNPPLIDADNPEGINMYDYSADNVDSTELVSMDDGWYGDVEYPDDLDEEEQERMNKLWDEDSYEGWEVEGWYQSETEAWFFGPLDIVREQE
jgi:hypothetical protein